MGDFFFSIPISLVLATAAWFFSVYSLFFFTGPVSWISGFVYVTYDTLLIAFVAYSTVGREREKSKFVPLEKSPSLGMMITGRNEAHVIARCLEAVARQTVLPDEVLWVDDGSTDGSLSVLESWKKDPRLSLRVHAKRHSGKASSMNEGWPTLNSDIVVTLDADTLLEPGAANAIRQAFAQNPQLAVSGGILEVHSFDHPGTLFESFQRFEYMRSFIARKAWMNRSALILVSGAFAAYRKSVLEITGGFDPTSRVEDYELTHRIYRFGAQNRIPWDVEICTGAWATTDVPGRLSNFLKQRERWFAGFIETHWKNRDLVGNPQLGNLGRWMLPLKSFDMIQPLLGLTAFAALLTFIVRSSFTSSRIVIPRLVVQVLVTKILIDLCFHYYSIAQYYRWKENRVPVRIWLASTVSTFLEPFSFQLFRHTGALMGWVAVVKRRKRW